MREKATQRSFLHFISMYHRSHRWSLDITTRGVVPDHVVNSSEQKSGASP